MSNKKNKKKITAWCIVNWKKGTVRARKTKVGPTELGTNELLAKLEFTVNIPEVDVPTLAAEIDVPEPMVYSAALDALDERDLPDYAKIADQVIADRADVLASAPPEAIDDAIAGVVLETCRQTATRPRVERVEEYVREVVENIRGEEVEA